MECFYDTLNVDRNATTQEIKRSYRKLVLKYHPDKNNGSKECEEKIKKINLAYECLSTPSKRIVYDEKFSNNIPSSFTPSSFLQNITITFEESFFGCVKNIQITDITGTVRYFPIQILPGVYNGQRFHLNTGTFEYLITVNVSLDSFYIREGFDLYCDITIPYIQTLTGTTIDHPRLGKLYIPPGTMSGDTITIPNKGMPIPNTNCSFGNLYIKVLTKGLVDFNSVLSV